MSLVDALRKSDKSGTFTSTPTSISYPTGFPTLDYRNGFILEAFDMETNEMTKEQVSVGIVDGTFNTVIGLSGTAKTTFVVQAAYNIVKDFESGLIYHGDLENSTSLTRVRNITGMSTRELHDKYILKKENVFIEDIYETVMLIYEEKMSNPKKYMYNTGIIDEFGKEVWNYVPTVFILDSIPSLALRNAGDDKKRGEMQTETYATRKAKSIAQFYRGLGPYIKEANIIIFAINHINDKIDINPFQKTQSQVMYLRQGEHLPGGTSPIYYANNIFKFVSNDKYTEEKHGFDGFNIKCELIKSRTNKAGQFANLAYDQVYGFSHARTMLTFIDELGLLSGRNPHRYITGYPEHKFSTKKFPEKLGENEELQKIVIDVTIPYLKTFLSRGHDVERKKDSELMADFIMAVNADEEHVEMEDLRLDPEAV